MQVVGKMEERQYLCIDLKSFYASVECVERGLDPMRAKLVVADPARSKGTICLAVSPALKALGVKNRCRIHEIPKHMDYITAVPRMRKYIDYAAEIYGIYLRYLAPEDIHVYSIDEAFRDVTPYLSSYYMTAKEMAVMLMERIAVEIGVRATCGIGTNLYLAKVALDILAKHAPDFIAALNENTYREKLWDHRPLTDFWRIGSGTAARLSRMGISTMRGISEADPERLYRIFGIDAELLIDHAWGRESTTMRDIKAYKPKTSSLTSGQVLMRDYSYQEGELILQEMTEQLCLDMLEKGLRTSSMTFYVGYNHDAYRPSTRATARLPKAGNLRSQWVPAILSAYHQCVKKDTPIRRFSLVCNDIELETNASQLTLFDTANTAEEEAKERAAQKAVLRAREKYGKNAVVKAADLSAHATAMERNCQIGGHKG